MTGVIVGVFVGRLALAKISIVVLALDSGRSRSSRQPCSRARASRLGLVEAVGHAAGAV
jgi:hypothetical protein